MEMMDYLYNEDIIMRNHDAQLIRESEERGISIGRNEGIAIGRNEGISIGRQDLLMQMIANGEISADVAAKYTERIKGLGL